MPPLGLGAAAAFGGAGADQVALNIGEAAENGNHHPPGAGAGVGPRLRKRAELRLGVHDPLDDLEQVEGAAGEAIDARHRHHVAGGQAVEHTKQFAPVGARARHLLAVDVSAAASGGAELVELGVEGLPVGRDAGIADEAFFGVSFGHILRQI